MDAPANAPPQPAPATLGEAATAALDAAARLQRERVEGFGRVLKIGAATAGLTMVLDALVFLETRSEPYLLFAMLAALVLVTVVYGLINLQSGNVERAVAVPLLYLLAVAPVGPFFIPDRALVSIALPFIAMAAAMNYASARHLRGYGLASWFSAATVLGLWQYNMVQELRVDVGYAIVNVITASVIVAFAFYALSHYSRRLQRSFDDVAMAHGDLAEAHGELREVDAARVRFMNNAAHELKTPLTPIRIQLQLLKRSRLATEDPRTIRSVEILDRNFTRLQRLVSDILDGARMDAGRLDIRPVPLDLSDILREAAEEFAEPAGMSGIKLEANIEPDLLVLGDPLRVRQIVDNLVSNAMKFTHPGGTVRIEGLIANDEVCVNVTDDGIGIAPQDLHKLFLPFRQVHDPMEYVTAGSGLGLYISKGIIERHGGRIWGESGGLGKGSTFSFCIPRLSGAVPVEMPGEEKEGTAGAWPAAGPRAEGDFTRAA